MSTVCVLPAISNVENGEFGDFVNETEFELPGFDAIDPLDLDGEIEDECGVS